jgi:hypothetical protein
MRSVYVPLLCLSLFLPLSCALAEEESLLSLLVAGKASWNKLPAKGDIPPSVNGHTAVVYKDTMYVFGGCTSGGLCSHDVFAYHPQLTILCHVDREQEWMMQIFRLTPNIPSPREGHAAALANSTMFIHGGSNHQGILSDMWALDLETVSDLERWRRWRGDSSDQKETNQVLADSMR